MAGSRRELGDARGRRQWRWGWRQEVLLVLMQPRRTARAPTSDVLTCLRRGREVPAEVRHSVRELACVACSGVAGTRRWGVGSASEPEAWRKGLVRATQSRTFGAGSCWSAAGPWLACTVGAELALELLAHGLGHLASELGAVGRGAVLVGPHALVQGAPHQAHDERPVEPPQRAASREGVGDVRGRRAPQRRVEQLGGRHPEGVCAGDCSLAAGEQL